jgi:hypothetical protein
MGMQVPGAVALEDGSASTISGRPSVVIVGPPNVGKHSILKRMLTVQKLNFSFRLLRFCTIACLWLPLTWKLDRFWEVVLPWRGCVAGGHWAVKMAILQLVELGFNYLVT